MPDASTKLSRRWAWLACAVLGAALLSHGASATPGSDAVYAERDIPAPVYQQRDLGVYSPFAKRATASSDFLSTNFTDQVQWDEYSLLVRGQRIFL